MLDSAKTIGIEKVAEHLGVSGWTIRTWIRAGLLSSHKIGRRVLLVEDEVRELMSRTFRPAQRPNGATTVASIRSAPAPKKPRPRRVR